MPSYPLQIYQADDALHIALPLALVNELSTILQTPIVPGLVLELAVDKANIELLVANHPEEPHDGLRTTLRLGPNNLLTLRLPQDICDAYQLQAGQALRVQTLETKALLKPKHALPDNRMKPY